MKKLKDFINAYRLNIKRRKEQQLLRDVVYYALSLTPSFITDRQLLFLTNYSKEIVASVATQLSLNFKVFHPRRNSTIIVFSEK